MELSVRRDTRARDGADVAAAAAERVPGDERWRDKGYDTETFVAGAGIGVTPHVGQNTTPTQRHRRTDHPTAGHVTSLRIESESRKPSLDEDRAADGMLATSA